MEGRGVNLSIEVPNHLIVKQFIHLVSNGPEHWDNGTMGVWMWEVVV